MASPIVVALAEILPNRRHRLLHSLEFQRRNMRWPLPESLASLATLMTSWCCQLYAINNRIDQRHFLYTLVYLQLC